MIINSQLQCDIEIIALPSLENRICLYLPQNFLLDQKRVGLQEYFFHQRKLEGCHEDYYLSINFIGYTCHSQIFRTIAHPK